MKPAPFDYYSPKTIDDVVNLLSEYKGRCEILAGGQSLVPMMNFRRKKPEVIIDINSLENLSEIREENDHLVIGALVRQSELMASDKIDKNLPIIPEALSYVGHKPTRHRGTIGGNLINADPASELPAVALLQNAICTVRNSNGTRRISVTDLFKGGMETTISNDEILINVDIPTMDDDSGFAFIEQRPRDHDWAVVGVAVRLSKEDGVCKDLALTYTGIDDRAIRMEEAENDLIGSPVNDESFKSVAKIARNNADPPSLDEVSVEDLKNNQRTGPTDNPQANMHAPPEFRKQLVETLTHRALTTAAERVEE